MPENIKFLGKNIGNLTDISLSDVFVDLTLKAGETKSKNQQMGLHQLKSFWTAKETIIKMKGNLVNEKRYLQIIYLIRS